MPFRPLIPINIRVALIMVASLLCCLSQARLYAGSGEDGCLSTSEDGGLAVYEEREVRPRRLEGAKVLADWSRRILSENQAKVAFIARNGTRFARSFDKTGMGHGGLVVWDPQKADWVVYQLMSDKHAPDYNRKDPRSKLYVSTLLTFFSGQRSDKREGLILIPRPQTQEALQEILLKGYNSRFFYTDRYDFLSRVNDTQTLNCIKWVLTLIIAAESQTCDLTEIASRMQVLYRYPRHDISLFQRPFLRLVPGLRMERIPWRGTNDLVVTSSEGLYYLDVFPVKRFYSGRVLHP